MQISGPLSDVVDVDTLESRYSSARLIIETWFTNYKGRWCATSAGFGGAAAVVAVVLEASQYFEAGARSTEQLMPLFPVLSWGDPAQARRTEGISNLAEFGDSWSALLVFALNV